MAGILGRDFGPEAVVDIQKANALVMVRRKRLEEKGKEGCKIIDLFDEASRQAVAAAPEGNASHRIYVCPRFATPRMKYVDAEPIAEGRANPGTLTFERD